MRRHLLRILDYLSIAAFVVTLAVWPLSDEILCDVRFGRLAAGVRGGGYPAQARVGHLPSVGEADPPSRSKPCS